MPARSPPHPHVAAVGCAAEGWWPRAKASRVCSLVGRGGNSGGGPARRPREGSRPHLLRGGRPRLFRGGCGILPRRAARDHRRHAAGLAPPRRAALAPGGRHPCACSAARARVPAPLLRGLVSKMPASRNCSLLHCGWLLQRHRRSKHPPRPYSSAWVQRRRCPAYDHGKCDDEEAC